MSSAVRRILDTFDALPEADKQQLAVEILRRSAAEGDLPEVSLVGAAEELFQGLDAEEGEDAPR